MAKAPMTVEEARAHRDAVLDKHHKLCQAASERYNRALARQKAAVERADLVLAYAEMREVLPDWKVYKNGHAIKRQGAWVCEVTAVSHASGRLLYGWRVQLDGGWTYRPTVAQDERADHAAMHALAKVREEARYDHYRRPASPSKEKTP